MSDLPMPDITRCLCWYDPRNPNYLEPDSDDEVRPPRIGCSCDNCFYGRDGLAIEILRLTAERDALTNAKISEDAYRQLMKHAHRLAMDGHGELAQHLRDAIYGRGPWENSDAIREIPERLNKA